MPTFLIDHGWLSIETYFAAFEVVVVTVESYLHFCFRLLSYWYKRRKRRELYEFEMVIRQWFISLFNFSKKSIEAKAVLFDLSSLIFPLWVLFKTRWTKALIVVFWLWFVRSLTSFTPQVFLSSGLSWIKKVIGQMKGVEETIVRRVIFLLKFIIRIS